MRAAGHFQVAGADVNATPSQTSAPQPPPTGNIFVGGFTFGDRIVLKTEIDQLIINIGVLRLMSRGGTRGT